MTRRTALLSLALLTILVTPLAAADTASTAPALDLMNARTPYADVVSGGQITEAQLEEAAEAGYTTVITLRTEGENTAFDEPAKVEALGMRFVRIPVAGSAGLTVDNARALAEALSQARIENPGPIVLHCGSGHRVGALLALIAHHVDGQGAAEALQFGRDNGLRRPEPGLMELLGSPAED